jgi:hypothetical protein
MNESWEWPFIIIFGVLVIVGLNYLEPRYPKVLGLLELLVGFAFVGAGMVRILKTL